MLPARTGALEHDLVAASMRFLHSSQKGSLPLSTGHRADHRPLEIHDLAVRIPHFGPFAYSTHLLLAPSCVAAWGFPTLGYKIAPLWQMYLSQGHVSQAFMDTMHNAPAV